jgi:DNA-binding transcriptional LysR family regulator
MTLEQLRIFIAVAERQHVTRAAVQLNLTQSTVSSAVTSLELRHGVALFDRVGRNIVLNQAGEAFLEEARNVVARVAAAEAVLDDLGGLAHGRLAIHASQTIANYWLPARLAAFHRACPGIALAVAIGNTALVARAVTEGTAELGLVEGEVTDHPALNRTTIGRDRLSLVVGRDHAWVNAPPSDIAQFIQTSWVLREPGSGTRSTFEAMLTDGGLEISRLDIAMVLPGNEAVRGAVEAGAGAGVISSHVAASGLAAGTLVEIPYAMPVRAFSLLRHKERYRSRAGDRFIEIAKALG